MSADNANGLAIAAAMASLEDETLLTRSRATNEEARRIALEALAELGLECLPSHTNFLMHRVAGDLDIYIRRMAEHGIRVGRPFPPLLSYNRLSLGLPTQMHYWADTLRDFRSRGWI
jgi:histidinol-phosphate aminotransferase